MSQHTHFESRKVATYLFWVAQSRNMPYLVRAKSHNFSSVAQSRNIPILGCNGRNIPDLSRNGRNISRRPRLGLTILFNKIICIVMITIIVYPFG